MTIHELIYILTCKFINDPISSFKPIINSITIQIYDMNKIDMDKEDFVNWVRWDVEEVKRFLEAYNKDKLYHFINQTDKKKHIIKKIDQLFDRQVNVLGIDYYSLSYYRNITFDQIPDELKT